MIHVHVAVVKNTRSVMEHRNIVVEITEQEAWLCERTAMLPVLESLGNHSPPS